ncbi:MAG: hypothetical protein ABJE47_18245 [bacterium]
MRTAATRHPFLTAALLLTAASSAFGQNTPSRLVQFLHDNIGLGDKQLAAMERGEIVVKALDTRDKRDVAIFAIVTTSVSRDAYTQRLRDFQSWLPRPSRTHYGVFSDPPVAQDVRSLVLDARGIDELKNCQPHACDVKLPATEMQKFREQLAAGGDDQLGAITQYAKQRLVEYIGDYRMHGDSTMTVYDDDKSSVRASDAFAALLARRRTSTRMFRHSRVTCRAIPA